MILSILAIVMIQCAGARNVTTDNVSALIQDKSCPLLFYYDDETSQCECMSSLFGTSVMCANDRAFLSYNYCLMYNEEKNILSVSFCPYFALNGHNTSIPGLISLPENISELNDYMCGPMNRHGIVCSECIDGYGPSVTSIRFRCSDCSNSWYGVPLYLLLELVPVTIFYLIMIIFQVNVTSAPMVSFIFYSNAFRLNFLNVVDQNESPVYGTILTLKGLGDNNIIIYIFFYLESL